MQSFRTQRVRVAALALLPATALIAIGAATGANVEPAEAAEATFKTDKTKVGPGKKVVVEGRFPARAQSGGALGGARQPASAEQGVSIQYKQAGTKQWRKAKVTRTNARGRFRERIKVRYSGRLRATAADGRRSSPERIRIKSRINGKVADRHVKRGKRARIKGQVRPNGVQRPVVVKVGKKRITTKTNRKGRFAVRWKANGTGTKKVRVKARGDKLAAGNQSKAGKVTSYRPAQASWYGPGFYGNRTACGQTLTTSTVGVAHKTMPCGTRLTLMHGKRKVTVKVIDRGPYVHGREFDLTAATKRKLNFGSTGTVYSSR
jgi:rare lipoprotein A